MFNPEFIFHQIGGDGNCMLNSVLCQLELATDDDVVLFTSMYICRMAIRHFLEHYEQLKENISFGIEAEYGRVDSEVGPFAMKTWCEEMLKDKVYGDLCLLKLIASMWSVRITVIRGDSLVEIRIRHDLPLTNTEIVLVYDGVPLSGHYCGAIKGTEDTRFMKLDCKKVVMNQKYEKDVDIVERLQRKDVVWDLGEQTMVGEKVLIDKSEYETLKRKAAQLDQVNIVLKGGQVPDLPSLQPQPGPSKTPATPGTSQHEGKEDAPGQKKKRPKTQFQAPSEVPEYNIGDTQCPKCSHKAKTTNALKLHMMKSHQDKYLYFCEVCDKGFTQREGFNNHKLVHAPDSERIQCTHEDCDVTFNSTRNLKAHLKTQHGVKRYFVCPHSNKSYSTRGIQSEHIKGCEKNPSRVALYCDICPEGTSRRFYLEKRVMEHKRDVHGWK